MTSILAFLIFSASAQASHNLNPFSYYQLIMDPAPDRIEELLGEPCVQQLREYFNAGHDLDVPELRQLATRADEFKYASRKKDLVFYHYTDANAVKNLAQDGDLSGIFRFIRAPGYEHHTEMFIAEDHRSSKSYGVHQTRITLFPNALILSAGKDIESIPLAKRKAIAVPHCNWMKLFFNLVLEESGITLYDYYNVDQWFYIADSRGIESFSFGKTRKRK